MAGSLSEAAKALNLSVSVNPAQGVFSFNISTDNVEIALEALKIVSKGAAALGALYVAHELLRPLIKTAVRNSVGGERDDQVDPDVVPGSLHVRLRCFTDARFLELLADYETGRIKQRLQEEFSQVGIKVEGLKVVIENMAEVNKTREAINKRRKNLIKDPREEQFDIKETKTKESKFIRKDSMASREEIRIHKKCLKVSTANHDPKGIAVNSSRLGDAYLTADKYKKAIECFENSLEIFQEIGLLAGIALSNGKLGKAYVRLGQYKSAIQYSRQALELNSKLGDRSEIAKNNANLGHAYLRLGEYQKAIGYYEKGLQISTEIGDRLGIAINKGNLGSTYHRLGQYNFGASYLVTSIAFFDEIFFDFVPDKNKLEFTQQYFKSHLMLMSCFLSVQRIESALLVCDLGRAKELHFCIQKQDNTVQKDMFDYARAMWDLINAGEEQVQLLKEFDEIVAEGKSDTSILIFAFDADGFLNVWVLHDQVFFRKIEVSFETISVLIMLLFMPLNVSVDRNSSFNKAALATGDIPSIRPESANKKASEKSAANRINLNDREILKTLFQDIFGSVVDLFKGNKLIVVPHKSLFFTPFSALIDENGRYLSDRYSIQITPSLHTLKCSVEQSRDAKLGFALFVGNPAVGTVSLNGKEVSIADLPNAAAEVKCLSKLFEASPLLGREARKDVVLQLIGLASLIHISAHGEPTRGEIMLAPNSSPGEPCSSVPKPESYLLTQEDIMNVSVKARLVVLCCCDTGQGKISSEGVIGITRAFMAAGARSVLATLWPIDDYASKEFMEKFYDELCQETSVCEALKRTKNFFQLHTKEHYRSFKIWAPFTIYGEDVKFEKDEIEEIKERSREMSRDLVVLP